MFFMIGALSYTLEKENMKNIPWFYITYPNANDDVVYFSLKGQYIEEYNQVNEFGNYVAEFKKCDTDGYSSYVLVIIACLSSLCCAFLSGALIKNDFTFGQFIGCGLAGLACFMSGVSLAVFMGDCQNTVADTYSANYYDFHMGAGAVLTVVGMVLMFCVSAAMFLTARFCATVTRKDDDVVPFAAVEVENPLAM